MSAPEPEEPATPDWPDHRPGRGELAWAVVTFGVWCGSFAVAMVGSSSASPHPNHCVTHAAALTEINVSALLLLVAGVSALTGALIARSTRKWFVILLGLCVIGFLGWFVVDLQTGLRFCPDHS